MKCINVISISGDIWDEVDSISSSVRTLDVDLFQSKKQLAVIN